ncbi:MAG: arsenate reductase ArsC, partial [Euryarchaeota archaeon]|nr:arsenate reductase ArsC [Euryarchaeota archaeon]
DPCKARGTNDELLNVYRKTRDDIIKWIDDIFGPEA